jgi:hypothetical protein
MGLQCFFTIGRGGDRYGVGMKLVLSAALVALASSPALADDDDVAPPSSVDPAPPAAPAPPQNDWGCHGSWRWHHGGYASRFAIGIGHGHYEVTDGADEGHQRSLLARIGLHHGFEVELEMARTELDGGDELHGGGAALVKSFGHRHLRPYVLAGVGGGRIEPDAGADTHFRYAELGGGLMLRGRHLALAVDLRHGVRKADAGDAMTTAARMTTPGDDTRERTTRGRILALVYF